MLTELYKRNANGEPIFWSIDYNDNGTSLIINHGKVITGQGHTEVIPVSMASGLSKEINSRIEEKRKAGYKYLYELFDNAPTEIVNFSDKLHYLNTYLPKYNGSANGNVLPMLAKTLENNRPFVKYKFLGQWKINGLRCLVGAKSDPTDMFQPIKLTFQSREGESWNLPYLEELLLGVLEKHKDILDMMLEDGAKLDGEVYYPDLKVNDINHLVKNPIDPRHKYLQYWIYDLAIENTICVNRTNILTNNFQDYIKEFKSKEEHLNNKDNIVLLPSFSGINNLDEAVIHRDKFIDLGFEGLILRNMNIEYGFGARRVDYMYKFKRIEDGWFTIVDIVPEGKKRTDLCKLVLRNDITEDLFECTLNASHTEQKEVLANKFKYINKKAFVEYRERSGVTQVPFHAKAIKIE